MEYFLIFVSAIFVNNILLAQFLGICPFLGVSNKLSTATGMSGAVCFVITLATVVTYLLNQYLLVPFGLEFLQTISFILVIAALRMMFSILVTILKVLPPLAKVGELGVNLVTGVVGFIWSLLVILIAWVAYRPVLAIALAVAIAALVYFLVSKSKKAPEAAPVAAAEAPKAE